MTTDIGTLSPAAANPFAAFLSPELVIAAHERMGARSVGVVHRPLDKPRLVKAGLEAMAAVDDEVEGETEFGVEDDFSDILDDAAGQVSRFMD